MAALPKPPLNRNGSSDRCTEGKATPLRLCTHRQHWLTVADFQSSHTRSRRLLCATAPPGLLAHSLQPSHSAQQAQQSQSRA